MYGFLAVSLQERMPNMSRACPVSISLISIITSSKHKNAFRPGMNHLIWLLAFRQCSLIAVIGLLSSKTGSADLGDSIHVPVPFSRLARSQFIYLRAQ